MISRRILSFKRNSCEIGNIWYEITRFKNSSNATFRYTTEISGCIKPASNINLSLTNNQPKHPTKSSTMRQFTGFLLLAVCTLLPPLSVTGNPHARVKNDVQRRDTLPGRSTPAAGKGSRTGRDVLDLRHADPSPSPAPLCPPGQSPCYGSGIWWDAVAKCIPNGMTCCPGLSILSKFWFPLPLTFCRSRCLLLPWVSAFGFQVSMVWSLSCYSTVCCPFPASPNGIKCATSCATVV